MLGVFDYVFVRAAEFFFKRDGIRADRALWTIVSMQGLTLLNLVGTVLFFIDRSVIKAQIPLIVSAWAGLLISLFVLNRRRYDGRFYAMQRAHVESIDQRRLRGALIIIVMLILAYYPLFLFSLLPALTRM